MMKFAEIPGGRLDMLLIQPLFWRVNASRIILAALCVLGTLDCFAKPDHKHSDCAIACAKHLLSATGRNQAGTAISQDLLRLVQDGVPVTLLTLKRELDKHGVASTILHGSRRHGELPSGLMIARVSQGHFVVVQAQKDEVRILSPPYAPYLVTKNTFRNIFEDELLVVDQQTVNSGWDWVVDKSGVEFGSVSAGATLEGKILIKNRGLETLSILQARPSCPSCMQVRLSATNVEPDEILEIYVEYDTLKGAGGSDARVVIETNDPGIPIAVIPVSVSVSNFRSVPAQVQFGRVIAGKSASTTLTLIATSEDSVKIVKSKERCIECIAIEGHGIEVRLQPDCSIGVLATEIEVLMESGQMVNVPVRADIIPYLTAYPNSIFKTELAKGQWQIKADIRAADGEVLQMAKVEFVGEGAELISAHLTQKDTSSTLSAMLNIKGDTNIVRGYLKCAFFETDPNKKKPGTICLIPVLGLLNKEHYSLDP